MHNCNSVGLNVPVLFAGAGFITQRADRHLAFCTLPCLIKQNIYVTSWNKWIILYLIYSNYTEKQIKKKSRKKQKDISKQVTWFQRDSESPSHKNFMSSGLYPLHPGI